MKYSKILVISFLALTVFSCKNVTNAQVQEQSIVEKNAEIKLKGFPIPIGYVNDFEHVFTENEIKELENKIVQFGNLTSNEIAIISIDSIGLYTDFDNYALDISKAWGVGKKEKNNGLTIVISTKLKKISIKTGLGTEKILSDGICKNVIDSFMVPEFKNGNYFKGVNNGLNELMIKWQISN